MEKVTKEEGTKAIGMIKSRNETSHIYHQEIADDIAGKIPHFYALMQTVVERIVMRVNC